MPELRDLRVSGHIVRKRWHQRSSDVMMDPLDAWHEGAPIYGGGLDGDEVRYHAHTETVLVRKGQQERLLEDGGVYLFAVCEPSPDRDVIRLKVVPATIVDELINSWTDLEGRPSYTQLGWTNIFDPSEVEG